MYKMMIADDEPKIRNGLRKMLDYSQFGIEVVGEAEDGEITLREAAKKKPDILFLDICMPFLNGLELIGKLKEQVDCLIVIITGYDQFAYMQEAIKLQVFDYLLKPVSKADLTDTAKRVCSELDKRRSKDRYFKWVNDRIEENFDTMRDNFFQNLTRKGMDSEQITSGLRFFNIHFTEQIGIVVLKIIKHSQFSKEVGGLDPNMMLFGVKNMAEELLGSDCFFCFFDDAGNIVIIGNTRGIERWSPFCSDLCAHLGEYVGGSAAFESGIVNSLTDVTAAYQELAQELKRKTAYRPITSSILQYIDLSVGSIIAISAAISATVIVGGGSVAEAVFAGIASGVICGVWNGLLVSYIGIQPMVGTLILYIVGRGIAQLITKGQILTFTNPDFINIGTGYWFVPIACYIGFAVIAVIYLLMRKTSLGLFVESIGVNSTASRYSGINAKRIIFFLYVISGILASISGVVICSNIKCADANNAGLNMELDAILATVIGGTSMNGGRFYLGGTVVGALFLQALTTTIYSLGVPTEITLLVKAVIVIIVCVIQTPAFQKMFRKKNKAVIMQPAVNK